ncbi:MAG TPA: hypothetical protein VNM16_07025 [Bacillota bacterium]|nr:hypothetical protein [Bacillota bacterium]
MSAAAGALFQSLIWAITGIFGGLVQTLAGPAGALLQTSLTQPYPFGPGVQSVWAFTRDLGLTCLAGLLAYGALRHMLGTALGLPGASPGMLIARMLVAATGAAFSFTLVNWLLAANAALVGALIATGVGQGGFLTAMLGSAAAATGASAAAAAVDLVAPEALALVCLGAALWVVADYYLRAAEILLLAAIAPVAAVLWMLPEASGVWGVVLLEALVAIFTQAAQLLLVWLAAAAGMGGSGGALGNLLLTLALLVMLARVRPLLQTLARGGRAQAGWGSAASWRAVRGVSTAAVALAGRLARGVMP